jgi:formylglycine-generating enzyme required for sulfatase activity
MALVATGMNDGDRPIGMDADMEARRRPRPDGGLRVVPPPVTPDAGAAAPVKPKRSTKGMVLIKGGTFTMGRAGASKYEGPPVAGVKVADFYLDEVEVSVTRYAKYLRSAKGKGVRVPWTGDAPPKELLKLPVTLVTWQEAKAYCEAKGKRLPREAEWEYAARGPKHDQLFPWGEKFDPAKVVCSVAKATELQPVRSGTPIEGLYHLIGNAWEWVADEARPYPGANWKPLGTQYVIRGGGAESKADKELTATYRLKNFGHENPKTKKLAIYKYLGFRCAMDAVEP